MQLKRACSCIRIDTILLKKDQTLSSLVIKKEIHLSGTTAEDDHGCDERIRDALGLAPLAIPLPVIKKVAARSSSARFSCIIGRSSEGYKLIDVERKNSYSLALDLGTTNLVLLLYDNVRHSAVLTMSFENPQIAFGSDILTRMHHALSKRSEEVYDSLKRGVNRAIRTICNKAGIATGDVHALAVAGNTAMSHFFLGLDISTIPAHPFIPAVRTPGFSSAAVLALELHPEALVYVFPNAGSYVGGDIVAGIIAAGLHRSEDPCVLIDVGTNAEVVIGNKDWMIVGAGAAGPALEEGISRVGKRASGGIIYDVEIRNGKVSCKTFDQQPPEGICGSGMVSLVYALFKEGVIDQTGALNVAAANVTTVEDGPAYAIPCGCGEPLLIRQTEIRNFMKSKAAMFTLLLVLARSVGITFKDISRVFVSGALGTGIDAKKAAAIGMLPAWPADIVKPLGNTSLQGARMVIENADLIETVNAVTEKITYKHMHDDPEFMKEFMGAVFIPHTNPELLKAD